MQRIQAAPLVVPTPDGCYPGFTTAEGCNALRHLTSGAGNTGIGWYSLFAVGGANYNTGVGAGTLVLNTADSNTAVGTGAMLLNTSGNLNTAVGSDALLYNDTGSNNIAIGAFALFNNTTGIRNAACGASSLKNNTTGGFNVAVGDFAGSNLTTGSHNIHIGHPGFADEHDIIRIGNQQAATFIAGIYAVDQGAPNLAVYVSSSGQLGTTPSSRRFKKQIKSMDKASEAILALKPVTFHYKSDINGVRQFGLIAEEVAEVNPDLVVRDRSGEVYSVRYDQVNAMLLNEFLKEHGAFVEQQRKVEDQQKAIDALKAELKEQRTLIQKVTD